MTSVEERQQQLVGSGLHTHEGHADTLRGHEPWHRTGAYSLPVRAIPPDRWVRAKDSAVTGLGLPIVKEIMDAHGGSISVTSEVHKGSVFTLRLPAITQSTVPA